MSKRRQSRSEAKDTVAARATAGAIIGLIIATLLSALVVILRIAGAVSGQSHSIGLLAIVTCYVASGLIGGAVAGAMAPIGRSLFGRILIATVVMTIASFGALVTLYGGPWQWSSPQWMALPVIGLVFGGIFGVWWGRIRV